MVYLVVEIEKSALSIAKSIYKDMKRFRNIEVIKNGTTIDTINGILKYDGVPGVQVIWSV